jgi:hypothetical protein
MHDPGARDSGATAQVQDFKVRQRTEQCKFVIHDAAVRKSCGHDLVVDHVDYASQAHDRVRGFALIGIRRQDRLCCGAYVFGCA